jgi:shikimate kinase
MFLELLQSSENSIIGLGGGTPCYANNHELLKRDDLTSIYLKASIETLYNRLIHNKSKRPLIANMNEEEMKEFIAKHLFDRSFYYNHAQHKVSVDNKTVEDTVQDILEILA